MENSFNEGEAWSEGESWEDFVSKKKKERKEKNNILKNMYNSILGNVIVTELSNKTLRIELEEPVNIDYTLIIDEKDVIHLHAILEDYMYETSERKNSAENKNEQ